jgi:hypothetical protein
MTITGVPWAIGYEFDRHVLRGRSTGRLDQVLILLQDPPPQHSRRTRRSYHGPRCARHHWHRRSRGARRGAGACSAELPGRGGCDRCWAAGPVPRDGPDARPWRRHSRLVLPVAA